MNDRESILPLLAGFALSVAVHLLAMPALSVGLGDGDHFDPLAANERPDVDEPLIDEKPLPEPEDPLIIGENDAPRRKTVAWISRDELEELLAPQSEVIQPAVQQKVDPVAEAPLRIDATAPPAAARLNSRPGQRPVVAQPTPQFQIQPPATEVAPPDQSSRQARAEGPEQPNGKPDDLIESITQVMKRADAAPTLQKDTALPNIGDLAESPLGLAMKDEPQFIDPILRDQSESAEQSDVPPINQPEAKTDQPDKESPKPPRKQEEIEGREKDEDAKPMRERVARDDSKPVPAGDNASEGAQGEDNEKPRTTSAPRDKKESAAFVLDTPLNIFKPGKVKVAEGLEIKTVAPRVDAIIYHSSKPTRGEFLITFDREGWVRKVEVVTSMRYKEVDNAVERAMYKWTAEGKQLEEGEGNIQLLMAVLPWR